jgi:hypothetical protein
MNLPDDVGQLGPQSKKRESNQDLWQSNTTENSNNSVSMARVAHEYDRNVIIKSLDDVSLSSR